MDMQEQEALIADLEPLLAGAGLTLVELSLSRHRGSVQVRAVVYAAAGTGTAECSAAHRLIYPRLQILLGLEDPFLEVASPGIDRSIRSPREWSVFKGKGVRVLLKESVEWIRGRILAAESGGVTIATSTGDMKLAFVDIAKARLDSSQEGD
jgi:ribosome maturation factor RimP